MCDNFFNPSVLKFLWKHRGNPNYIWKTALFNDTSVEYIVLEDIRNNREVLGKIVTSPREGEAYHWPRLQHENLATLIDTVSINEMIRVYITPSIGKCLRQVIYDEQFMYDSACFDRKKAYAEDILWALDYLHEKSLCLMNFTDAVICICDVSDKAVICDFSCLVLAERATKDKINAPPLYQAPEIRTADISSEFNPVAAEMWTCGVIMLQMFTRHVLKFSFGADELECVLKAVNEINYFAIKEANPGAELDFTVVADLKGFLNLFLNKNPKLRIKAKTAALSSFLRNSNRRIKTKDKRYYKRLLPKANCNGPWSTYQIGNIESYDDNKKRSEYFKDIYLKEAATYRDKLKQVPSTNKFINLDFIHDDVTSDKVKSVKEETSEDCKESLNLGNTFIENPQTTTLNNLSDLLNHGDMKFPSVESEEYLGDAKLEEKYERTLDEISQVVTSSEVPNSFEIPKVFKGEKDCNFDSGRKSENSQLSFSLSLDSFQHSPKYDLENRKCSSSSSFCSSDKFKESVGNLSFDSLKEAETNEVNDVSFQNDIQGTPSTMCENLKINVSNSNVKCMAEEQLHSNLSLSDECINNFEVLKIDELSNRIIRPTFKTNFGNTNVSNQISIPDSCSLAKNVSDNLLHGDWHDNVIKKQQEVNTLMQIQYSKSHTNKNLQNICSDDYESDLQEEENCTESCRKNYKIQIENKISDSEKMAKSYVIDSKNIVSGCRDWSPNNSYNKVASQSTENVTPETAISMMAKIQEPEENLTQPNSKIFTIGKIQKFNENLISSNTEGYTIMKVPETTEIPKFKENITPLKTEGSVFSENLALYRSDSCKQAIARDAINISSETTASMKAQVQESREIFSFISNDNKNSSNFVPVNIENNRFNEGNEPELFDRNTLVKIKESTEKQIFPETEIFKMAKIRKYRENITPPNFEESVLSGNRVWYRCDSYKQAITRGEISISPETAASMNAKDQESIEILPLINNDNRNSFDCIQENIENNRLYEDIKPDLFDGNTLMKVKEPAEKQTLLETEIFKTAKIGKFRKHITPPKAEESVFSGNRVWYRNDSYKQAISRGEISVSPETTASMKTDIYEAKEILPFMSNGGDNSSDCVQVQIKNDRLNEGNEPDLLDGDALIPNAPGTLFTHAGTADVPLEGNIDYSAQVNKTNRKLKRRRKWFHFLCLGSKYRKKK